jgi:hypothetical protein
MVQPLTHKRYDVGLVVAKIFSVKPFLKRVVPQPLTRNRCAG